MSIDWRVVPIEHWPGELTRVRQNHRFRRSVTKKRYDGSEYTASVSDVDWLATERLLEALRKVDRYGVTKSGEQYKGWKRLPAGGATPVMTARRAAEILVTFADVSDREDFETDVERVLGNDSDAVRWFYLYAAKATHPDVGGSTEGFQLLQEAKRVLDRHHGTL